MVLYCSSARLSYALINKYCIIKRLLSRNVPLLYQILFFLDIFFFKSYTANEEPLVCERIKMKLKAAAL